MTGVPADPAVEAATIESITERAKIAAEAGCLPAISGNEWLALIAEVSRLAAENADLRAANEQLHLGWSDALRRMDTLATQLAAVRALTVIAPHACNDVCEAFGCDFSGVQYVVPVERILAALAAAVPPTTEGTEAAT